MTKKQPFIIQGFLGYLMGAYGTMLAMTWRDLSTGGHVFFLSIILVTMLFDIWYVRKITPSNVQEKVDD